MVVGADGRPVGMARVPSGDAENADDQGLASMVEQPAKVMRIGTMIKQLLEEVRAAPLDEASRERLGVGPDPVRDAPLELGEEAGLAPGPLDDRLRGHSSRLAKNAAHINISAKIRGTLGA